MRWDLQEDFMLSADVWVARDWEIRQEKPHHFSVWHNWGGRVILHKEAKSLEEAKKYVERELKKKGKRLV
jgi:hypothetical protein